MLLTLNVSYQGKYVISLLGVQCICMLILFTSICYF